MNSMRALTFWSCTVERSTWGSMLGGNGEKAAAPTPRLMLEEVEEELKPESVMGEGWCSGIRSWTPAGHMGRGDRMVRRKVSQVRCKVMPPLLQVGIKLPI